MEMLTIADLLGVVGMAAVVTIVTQFLKGVTIPYNINPRFIAYFVALVVTNLAAVVSGVWETSFLLLSVVNAALVTLTSMGEYNLVSGSVGWFKSSTELRAAYAAKMGRSGNN